MEIQFHTIETAEGPIPSFAEEQIVAAETAVHERMGALLDQPEEVDSIVTSEGNLPAFETEE